MEKKDTQNLCSFCWKTKQELFELFHASANGLTEEQIERSRENTVKMRFHMAKHHSL